MEQSALNRCRINKQDTLYLCIHLLNYLSTGICTRLPDDKYRSGTHNIFLSQGPKFLFLLSLQLLALLTEIQGPGSNQS